MFLLLFRNINSLNFANSEKERKRKLAKNAFFMNLNFDFTNEVRYKLLTSEISVCEKKPVIS